MRDISETLGRALPFLAMDDDDLFDEPITRRPNKLPREFRGAAEGSIYDAEDGTLATRKPVQSKAMEEWHKSFQRMATAIAVFVVCSDIFAGACLLTMKGVIPWVM